MLLCFAVELYLQASFIFQPSDNLPVTFGTNIKAQLSARTAFSLAHKHGDILREGWQNLLVCMMQLFKTKLLPKILTEVCLYTLYRKTLRYLAYQSTLIVVWIF